MKPRVWVDRPLTSEVLDHLETMIEVIVSNDAADLPGVDAVIIGSGVSADAAFMDQAGPTLKAIVRTGIGVDNIDIPTATERGILVVHTPDAPTESTAEHAVAMLLALAKRIGGGDMSLRGKEIARSRLLGTEVRNRVLGVVGLGRIGRRVAEICAQGLKMRVVAYDPYLESDSAAALGVEMVDNLDALLERADFVTLHSPLTAETRHLIGEQELRRMKQGAYLINVSRGPVVDEAALARVMESGHLAGAALDVFEPEPPAPNNPLFRLSNVVVTPHIAAYTDRSEQGKWEGATQQMLQVLRGERPPFLVNSEAWPGRAQLISQSPQPRGRGSREQ
ncbi:hydroxyacid dehydrogenase [Acidobacteria bacterium AH-259-A15]|nr:hydroxyacid dehydrogenase [Acidobacteria bacterium AH-259-A15]